MSAGSRDLRALRCTDSRVGSVTWVLGRSGLSGAGRQASLLARTEPQDRGGAGSERRPDCELGAALQEPATAEPVSSLNPNNGVMPM